MGWLILLCLCVFVCAHTKIGWKSLPALPFHFSHFYLNQNRHTDIPQCEWWKGAQSTLEG